MDTMKRKQTRQYEESKGEKFVNWMKEKRFYIVLLCCIMAVSATYFVANSFQRAQTPVKQKQESTATARPSSTPLPDLTQGMPIEDGKTAKASAAPKASAKPAESPKPKSSAKPTAKPSTTPANAGADVNYSKNEKSKLAYPVSGEVITPHTSDTLIYSKTLGDWRSHEGVDIKAQIGTDVLAADAGVIEDVYTDDSMGITIVIDHQNGLKTVYSNLSNASLVQKGQSIARGGVISAVGDTAIFETGEVGHLHFEVVDSGKKVDPLTWLQK